MNREQQRFQAAVAAMRGILTYGGGSGVKYHEELAKNSVGFADALLAELDRTKPEPETPQPDADGWIPHRPGDPMPCAPGQMVMVQHADGFIHTKEKAEFWGGNDDDVDCWTGEGCDDTAWQIIAWKPA